MIILICGIVKNNFLDVFGQNPSNNTTMQVIIFDKFFKCIYRLHNIPSDGNFRKIGEMLQLPNPLNQYQAVRLLESSQFCIDDYVYDGKELKLTASSCN